MPLVGSNGSLIHLFIVHKSGADALPRTVASQGHMAAVYRAKTVATTVSAPTAPQPVGAEPLEGENGRRPARDDRT